MFLDATYLHVRRSGPHGQTAGGQVTTMAVVVATGVTAAGGREILGVDVGDSEDEVFWCEFLRTLKERGLSGVRPVISDQHAGMVAAVFRTAFAQPDAAAVNRAWDQVRDQLAASFPKIGPLMDEAKAEVLAFTAFPRPHWAKIWSTNPISVNRPTQLRLAAVA